MATDATRASPRSLPEINRCAVPSIKETDHISALSAIEDVQSLIHAAWMAAGAFDRNDQAAEQDALRAVLHLAGEQLCLATAAIKRAQSGRTSA